MASSTVSFAPRVLLLFVGLWAATFSSVRADAPPNFSGNYELAGKRSDREFSLEVKQKGSRAEVTFSASMADGTGAAPDGVGKGEIEDGVLSFKFKDSFNNEGTCTLQPAKVGFQLNINVTKVVDASPFHFYGELLMKKTSDHVVAP
jgi:hypothetical protein